MRTRWCVLPCQVFAAGFFFFFFSTMPKIGFTTLLQSMAAQEDASGQ